MVQGMNNDRTSPICYENSQTDRLLKEKENTELQQKTSLIDLKKLFKSICIALLSTNT